MNEKEFISALKGSIPSSLFLFYGADEYSKNICYSKLVKAIGCMEVSLIDGQALDLQRLHEECNSVSFFETTKCICVRNPMIESLNPSQLQALNTIIFEKPQSTHLIFIVKAQKINTYTDKKWAKLISEIEKNGTVIECSEKSTNDVVSMILSTAKKNRCSIDKSLATDLANRSLNDMLIIEKELIKLAAYAREKTDGIITADAIANLTARQLDYKTYEIVKYIIAKNTKTALSILKSLFLQQVDAIAISSSIASSFLDIYRVKTMQQYNHPISELSKNFDYKGKDYKLRGAGYDAQKCNLDFLRNAILHLSEADILLKSTKDNKQTVLEKTIIKIILGEKAVKTQ